MLVALQTELEQDVLIVPLCRLVFLHSNCNFFVVSSHDGKTLGMHVETFEVVKTYVSLTIYIVKKPVE